VTSKASDPFDFQRFVDAQNRVYEEVRAELRSGLKRGHLIWFIFPQLRGLGSSEMATKFGIASRQEAQGLPGPSGSRAAAEGVHSADEPRGGPGDRPDLRLPG
jgi:hypothetical protein